MVLESLLQSGLDARLTMGGGIFVRGESDVSFDDMDYSKTASLLKPQLLLSFREGRFNQEREFHRQIQLMLVGYEATEALYKKEQSASGGCREAGGIVSYGGGAATVVGMRTHAA